MINFLKNNFQRINSRRYYVIISLLMMVFSIGLAVYFNSIPVSKGSIAVVTQEKEAILKSNYLKFTFMEKEPAKSELVLGEYDGVIIDKGNGEYDIVTIKGDEYRKMLEDATNNHGSFVPPAEDERGAGTNIIGYLLMFILLQCVLFMFTLSEDMELKQIQRIAASPVSFAKYLFSHFVCTFALVFVPAFFILTVMKGIFGFNIGFNLPQYAALLVIICSLGTAFAMFINCLIKVSDTANMIGSSIAVLTTILSGSFYSFARGNDVLEKIISLLPQKAYLGFAQGLETGKAVLDMLPEMIYVIVITLLLFTFAVIKIKKDYVLRRG